MRGTSLAKRFVELHGRSIRVKGAPGQESTFAFILLHRVLEVALTIATAYSQRELVPISLMTSGRHDGRIQKGFPETARRRIGRARTSVHV